MFCISSHSFLVPALNDAHTLQFVLTLTLLCCNDKLNSFLRDSQEVLCVPAMFRLFQRSFIQFFRKKSENQLKFQ